MIIRACSAALLAILLASCSTPASDLSVVSKTLRRDVNASTAGGMGDVPSSGSIFWVEGTGRLARASFLSTLIAPGNLGVGFCASAFRCLTRQGIGRSPACKQAQRRPYEKSRLRYSMASCCCRFIQPARANTMNCHTGRIIVGKIMHRLRGCRRSARVGDITAHDWQELVTGAKSRTVMHVHVPSTGRNTFRHADHRGSHSHPVGISDNVLQGIDNIPLIATAASMDM